MGEPRLAVLQGWDGIRGRGHRFSSLLSPWCPPGSLKASAPDTAHLQHLRTPDGPQCQPLQSSQSIKGMNQRVVTLAQHISVTNQPHSPLPPSCWGSRDGGKSSVTRLVGMGWE